MELDKSGTQIKLTLQFTVQNAKTSICKEVVLDLDDPHVQHERRENPLRTVNRVTASIVRLVDETKLKSPDMRASSLSVQSPQQIGLPKLTQRENQVMKLVVGGATNQDIAQTLGVSVNTVKFHVKNVLNKLSARNRMELSDRVHRLLDESR